MDSFDDIFHWISRMDFTTAVSLLFILVASVHIIPYLFDPYKIRSNAIPGPLIAKFSDIWLGWYAAHGHRSEVVHSMHEKYGEFNQALVKLLMHDHFYIRRASFLSLYFNFKPFIVVSCALTPDFYYFQF